MADIRDILDIERPTGPEVTKEAILGPEKKAKRLIFNGTKASKRPEGMAREVFALLYNDKKDAPPVFPTDTGQGYKSNKAKLGMKSVRPWKWTPFSNPARKDNAMFFHWRRVCDEGKDYPFAKFNKVGKYQDVMENIRILKEYKDLKGNIRMLRKISGNQIHTSGSLQVVPIPTYTDAEYQSHLVAEGWTKPETDHLFDLCRRFDLRFVIIQDRYDYVQFKKRSIEELKERYYSVVSALAKVKTGPGLTAEAKIYSFDAEHERKRKEQLHRLYLRTSEQVEEEQMLQNELKKIEARKKERDKKTQDLQKLITAADHQQEPRKNDKKFSRKKIQTASSRPKIDQLVRQSTELSSIKFPDLKGSGVTVRSQRMKLPANIGQKKMKAIEAMLQELQTETNPMPTEENCTHFNELRSDLLLLYELKTAMANCEFELQALRHQYEAANPGKFQLVVVMLAFQKGAICGVSDDWKWMETGAEIQNRILGLEPSVGGSSVAISDWLSAARHCFKTGRLSAAQQARPAECRTTAPSLSHARPSTAAPAEPYGTQPARWPWCAEITLANGGRIAPIALAHPCLEKHLIRRNVRQSQQHELYKYIVHYNYLYDAFVHIVNTIVKKITQYWQKTRRIPRTSRDGTLICEDTKHLHGTGENNRPKREEQCSQANGVGGLLKFAGTPTPLRRNTIFLQNVRKTDNGREFSQSRVPISKSTLSCIQDRYSYLGSFAILPASASQAITYIFAIVPLMTRGFN
ncbi:unnamed protein product [Nesidiocoris tenuis]|uniref:DNA methyltransferase 1-associated protein 1 n=1 Tax=Nesidiocoris tenuis TaxID=355587 RepID=A0A6H5H5K5_9HEMI|nr:unnamed protein product [Nesidiocoris tenuis]